MEKMLRNDQVKRRVLVVDDEMINREILGNILHADYDVVYAGNGQQAIDILKSDSGSFSLILLDLLMPVLSGARVLDICRSDPELSGIPIIVMTQEEEAEVTSIRAGADDFIKKPYNMPEVILARCERIIDLYEKKNLIDSAQADPLTGLYSNDFFFEYFVIFFFFHFFFDIVGVTSFNITINIFHIDMDFIKCVSTSKIPFVFT